MNATTIDTYWDSTLRGNRYNNNASAVVNVKTMLEEKAFVVVSEKERGELLFGASIEGRERAAKYDAALGLLGNELSSVARSESFASFADKSFSGTGLRRCDGEPPVEGPGVRKYLPLTKAAAWKPSNKSNVKKCLQDMNDLVKGYEHNGQETGPGLHCEHREGSLLVRQIRLPSAEESDSGGRIMDDYDPTKRLVQKPHTDGQSKAVFNVIIALHPHTSLLIYSQGLATRVVLARAGLGLVFREDTKHGGDTWVNDRNAAPNFNYRMFHSISITTGSPSNGKRHGRRVQLTGAGNRKHEAPADLTETITNNAANSEEKKKRTMIKNRKKCRNIGQKKKKKQKINEEDSR
jgi:hypothetical protein